MQETKQQCYSVWSPYKMNAKSTPVREDIQEHTKSERKGTVLSMTPES